MAEPDDDPAEQFFFLQGQLGEAWESAKESLLAEWIESRPGCRPPGWWMFDAPLVDPNLEFDTSFTGGRGTLAPLLRRRLLLPGESDAAFLKRLGLLQRGEEERIPAEAFEPVAMEE